MCYVAVPGSRGFASSAREVTEIIFAEIELIKSVIYTSRGSRVDPRLLYTDGTDNNGWQGSQYKVLSHIIFNIYRYI